MLIMATLRPDLTAGEIVGELLRLRPRMWPNLRVIGVGDALLGRRGELVEAATELYRLLLQQDLSFHQLISDADRKRELDAALRS